MLEKSAVEVERCCGEVLEKSLGEGGWRRVLEKSVVEKCWRKVFGRSVAEKY